MRGVAVLGHVERVRHRVDLGLQPNLDDLHRAHDEDGFCYTCSETGCGRERTGAGFQPSAHSPERAVEPDRRDARTEEDARRGRLSGLFAGEEALVLLERSEPDRHFRHDAGDDGAETLVETERTLFRDDVCTGGDETARFSLQRRGSGFSRVA